MKIGILTFHNTTNYGAILQNYALNRVISSLNLKCETVDYHCQQIEYREGTRFPFRSFSFSSVKNYIKLQKKRKNIKSFKRKIAISKEKYDRSTIKSSSKKYDMFLVGSDMVWEPSITKGDMTFFLDFLDDDSKKYSYAASMGIDDIPDEYKDIIIPLLSSFERISVREQSAADIIQRYCKKEAEIVADPTLLLTADKWRDVYCKGKTLKRKYVLLYFLDKNGIMLNTAYKIAEECDCEIIVLAETMKKIKNCKVVRSRSVESFLELIDNAFLVITGSYHGMIFSNIFNTPFMYFNRANSLRMENLAHVLNCEDRRLSDKIIPKVKMDFSLININIDMFRKTSLEYLNSIIKERRSNLV